MTSFVVKCELVVKQVMLVFKVKEVMLVILYSREVFVGIASNQGEGVVLCIQGKIT